MLNSVVSTPAQPVVDTDALVATADTITLSWAVPPGVTGSEVSWELTEQTRRRRGVRNAEGGTSGPLPADQDSYTIDKLRSGTSYDITVTVFNPAGNSSTTFTRSTEEGSEFQRQFTQTHTSILSIHTHTQVPRRPLVEAQE